MSRLKRRIAELIAENGPLSVADYMSICLFDPQDGYYTTREPFGVAGDFTTAPEISQMFGELIAVWLYSAWEATGAHRPFNLAEIGPGRGTLMRDVVRTLRRLDPQLVGTGRFALVEVSPRLAELQRQTLAASGAEFAWHREVAMLPQVPTFLVGNEIFDAIPLRQFVRQDGAWHERLVGLDADGELRFVLGPGKPDRLLLPPGAAADGAIAELAPARSALMDQVAERIAAHGGAALFIDYGHLRQGFGDTLQAVRRHAYDGVLDHPGEADLTSHVDFGALARVAARHGLETRRTTQGDFLRAMGLAERAGMLGSAMDADGRARIAGAAERLAGPAAMGTLFKVIAVAPPGTDLPGFGAPH